MSLKDTLFSFKGRLRRRDWWLAAIGVGVTQSLVAAMLTQIVLGPAAYTMSDAFAGEPPVLDPRQTMISVAVALLFIWPSLALATKRTHDRDRSARLTVGVLIAVWILSFAPGSIYDLMVSGRWVETPLDIALAVLGAGVTLAKLWLFIVLGVIDGTKGPNRFGPSPKGAGVEPTERTALRP
ncbi:DUF805 domain-containing protein [Brevundimonas sp.]|uniref:DUF805 domain-containing protein n=1 Tax=Brevundimonas sp. TaxID=1871086 RepID=UPI002D5D0B57|nr:DUF805 domain-containing protein [Brevundimonas sp.]HYC98850.1 DUF805 domain-containing protein [Brevundimonas sp.]